jgi:hypothetical protein
MANLRNCAIHKIKDPRYLRKTLRQDMTSHARQQFALDLFLECMDASETDIKKAAVVAKNNSLNTSAAARTIYSLRSSKTSLPDPLLSPIHLETIPAQNIDSDDDGNSILSPLSLLSSLPHPHAPHSPSESDTTAPGQIRNIRFSDKHTVRTFAYSRKLYTFVDTDIDLPPDLDSQISRRQTTGIPTSVAPHVTPSVRSNERRQKQKRNQNESPPRPNERKRKRKHDQNESPPRPNERGRKRKQDQSQSPPHSHQTRKYHFHVVKLI